MKRYFVVTFILLISSIAISSGHTFRSVSMASNTLKGWVVASDSNGYLLHTADCGLTWISQSFLTSRYINDVFFLNEQKGWICTDQGFIFHTENGGIDWSNQMTGLAKKSNRISFLDANFGWIGCYETYFGRTTNGGTGWQQIFLPTPPFPIDTIDVWGVSFINKQKGWLCAGYYPVYWQPDTWFIKGQGYIAVSNDSGLNWQLLLRDTINDFFDIKMLDSLNGFVIGGNDRTMSATIMKTQNGGINWQPVTIPPQAKYLRSVKFLGNQAWAVGHFGTILHSDNGGNNWTMQTSPIDTTLYDIDFGDSLHGLIAGDGCVLYTHNGGVTWNVSNLGIEEEIALDFVPAMTQGAKVYPNPARTFFTIQIPPLPRWERKKERVNLQIKIYDVSGKIIREILRFAQNDKSVIVSLNGIKNGVYFIKVNDTLIDKKLVVAR